MLIEKFRSFIYKLNVKRSIVKKNKEQYRPSSKIQTIGIILDDRLNIDDKIFEMFIAQLDVSKSNLKFLIFSDNQKKEFKTESIFVKYMINTTDFEVFGKLKSDINPFFDLHFDLIINYYDESNVYLEYLSSKCRNCFSVGYIGANEGLNDLIFDFPANNTDSFLTESIKYLSTIFKL